MHVTLPRDLASHYTEFANPDRIDETLIRSLIILIQYSRFAFTRSSKSNFILDIAINRRSSSRGKRETERSLCNFLTSVRNRIMLNATYATAEERENIFFPPFFVCKIFALIYE